MIAISSLTDKEKDYIDTLDLICLVIFHIPPSELTLLSLDKKIRLFKKLQDFIEQLFNTKSKKDVVNLIKGQEIPEKWKERHV